ncbi:MAG: TetR/AcrR family transcriptional regulator [Nitrospirae bacterium]|nr:TetR/AcrR family transcriptional regulator [Nitrospirota bacterium]
MHGEQRREQILDSGTRLFAKKGYQETSISDVCKDLKIGRGTLYQYFGDKESLFHAALKRYAERISKFMKPFREIPIAPPRDEAGIVRLMTLRLELIFQTIMDDRDACGIVFKEAMAKNAKAEAIVHQIRESFLQLMIRDLEDGKRQGMLDLDDPRFVAEFLLGGLLHVASTRLIDTERPADPRALAEDTARLVVGAVYHRPAAG